MAIRTPLSGALVGLAAVAAMNFGCGGSPYVHVPTSSTRSTSKILAVVTNDGTISIYNLPINAFSTPVATIPETLVNGIAFDKAGRMFVDVSSGQIQVFNQPISNGATPAFVIVPSGSDQILFEGGLAFDTVGDLFVGGGLTPNGCQHSCPYNASVSVLEAPMSSSSAVDFTFLEGNGHFSLVSNAAFDKSGDLWAVVGEAFLDETVPPFSGNSQTQIALTPPYTIPLGVAFDAAGNMYVSTGRAPGSDIPGDIVVYHPPFTKSSQATVLFGGITFDFGDGLALDTSGNMYAATSSGLFMFSPPFTPTGTPVVTLPGSFDNVAIGP